MHQRLVREQTAMALWFSNVHFSAFRSSALRSSQNSLQSSITGPQRPSSAYYPPSAVPAAARSNLHQSIPNLKSPPSTQRIIQNEDAARSGSYPSVNQQQYPPQNYPGNATYGDRQTYNLPQHPPYAQAHYPQEGATRQYSGGPYLGQKINEGGPYHGYNGQQHYSAQDVYRHAQQRPEEMMRYPSANNVRIAEAQIQSKTQQDELNRQNEMRMSKSEDMLRQYAANNHNEILRYASSGNVRSQESSRVDLQPLKHAENRGVEERNHALKEESRNVRGQAKMAEMSEEVRRRQNRTYYQQQSAFPVQGNQNYYQQQHYNQHQQNYHPNPHLQMVQNTQSLQNLSLNQQAYPGNPVSYPYYQQNQPISSPNYPKTPPVAPKPLRKTEEPPELPPTSTHPLYSASSQDPPKMALYPNNNNSANVQNKTPRDPWAREEQERQAEIRREQARQWQEQQIRELLTLPNRTQQQEEQLRVLQLEREFQRRALEAAEQDDEDTEKVNARKRRATTLTSNRCSFSGKSDSGVRTGRQTGTAAVDIEARRPPEQPRAASRTGGAPAARARLQLRRDVATQQGDHEAGVVQRRRRALRAERAATRRDHQGRSKREYGAFAMS